MPAAEAASATDSHCRNNASRSYDFNNGIDYDKMFQHFTTMGFQGSNLASAIDEVNKMVSRSRRVLITMRYAARLRGTSVRREAHLAL